MIATSSEYQNEMKQQFRMPTDIRVSLAVTDEIFIDKDFDLDFSVQSYLGNPRNIFLKKQNLDKTYVSFEQDRFILGAGQLVIPENTIDAYNIGFESSVLSNENGYFDYEPFLNIVFKRKKTVFGITLTFDGELNQFPLIIGITIDGDSEEFEINNNEFTLNKIMKDISLVSISWIKIRPFQRARLRNIVFKTNLEFNKNDIVQSKGSKLINEIDPISRRLPTQTFNFNFINKDDLYDIDNPTGIYEIINEKQEINIEFIQDIFETGTTETLKVGKFYLDAKPIVSNDVVTLNSSNFISTANDSFIYRPSTLVPTTLHDLADAILSYGLGISNYKLNFEALSIWITPYIPLLPMKDLLRMIAEASMCIFWEDENGIIRIEPISLKKQDFKLDFNTISKNSLKAELSPLLKNLTVNIYQYELIMDVDEEGNAKELLNITLEPSETLQRIFIEEAIITDIKGETDYLDLDKSRFHMGMVDLKVTKRANIILQGFNIKTTKIEKTYYYNETGEDEVIDNPLITSNAQADQVAKWKSDYLLNRNTYSFNYRGNPELQATDLITSQTDFSDEINAKTIRNEIAYKGTISGSAIVKKVN